MSKLSSFLTNKNKSGSEYQLLRQVFIAKFNKCSSDDFDNLVSDAMLVSITNGINPDDDNQFASFISFLRNRISNKANIKFISPVINLRFQTRKTIITEDSILKTDYNGIYGSFGQKTNQIADKRLVKNDNKSRKDMKHPNQKQYKLTDKEGNETIFNSRSELYEFLGATIDIATTIKNNRTIHKKYKLSYSEEN